MSQGRRCQRVSTFLLRDIELGKGREGKAGSLEEKVTWRQILLQCHQRLEKEMGTSYTNRAPCQKEIIFGEICKNSKASELRWPHCQEGRGCHSTLLLFRDKLQRASSARLDNGSSQRLLFYAVARKKLKL